MYRAFHWCLVLSRWTIFLWCPLISLFPQIGPLAAYYKLPLNRVVVVRYTSYSYFLGSNWTCWSCYVYTFPHVFFSSFMMTWIYHVEFFVFTPREVITDITGMNGILLYINLLKKKPLIQYHETIHLFNFAVNYLFRFIAGILMNLIMI